MKRKNNLPFLFDMRGFWANERVDGKLWNLSNPVFKKIFDFFKKKERHYLTESDHTISLTFKGKEVIEQKLVKQPSPIAVIPCCVDTVHFSLERRSRVKQTRLQLNIPEDVFVLGYVGSIGTWYMLPEMVAYFKVLLRQKPEAIFLFITKEPKDLLENAFEHAGISLDHLRVQPGRRDEMPGYISLFDWSIFFIKPVFSKQASSPTKQGEIMRMGIPIVCNANIGDTDAIVHKYQSGIIVSSFDDGAYAKAIHEMDIFTWNPDSLSDGAADYFGLERGIDTYRVVYEKILNSRTP